jgi:hypothetical protein
VRVGSSKGYNKPHGCSTSGALATEKALEEEEEEHSYDFIIVCISWNNK